MHSCYCSTENNSTPVVIADSKRSELIDEIHYAYVTKGKVSKK